MTNTPTATPYEQRAVAALDRIREAGYVAKLVHYEPTGWDMLDRYYVIVDGPTFRYSAQWHQDAEHGIGFTSNQGDGYDENVAIRLNGLAVTR